MNDARAALHREVRRALWPHEREGTRDEEALGDRAAYAIGMENQRGELSAYFRVKNTVAVVVHRARGFATPYEPWPEWVVAHDKIGHPAAVELHHLVEAHMATSDGRLF